MRISFGRSVIISFVILFSYSNHLSAQSEFECYNDYASLLFDQYKFSRSFGEYEVEEEWSEDLTSEQVISRLVELEGRHQYVFLLITEPGIDASAVELRNAEGMQLEYIYKIKDFNKNQINFFYTATSDGIYELLFRIVNNKKTFTCSYMAILKGEVDPEYYGKQEQPVK